MKFPKINAKFHNVDFVVVLKNCILSEIINQ